MTADENRVLYLLGLLDLYTERKFDPLIKSLNNSFHFNMIIQMKLYSHKTRWLEATKKTTKQLFIAEFLAAQRRVSFHGKVVSEDFERTSKQDIS